MIRVCVNDDRLIDSGLNLRQILLWYCSMTFSSSMHVLWMEWKTCKAEESGRKDKRSHFGTLQWKDEMPDSKLWNMSSALVCRCPDRQHSSPPLPRTWPKLMLDVSAVMKYWFQPLTSRHSWNGGIDDGAERDGLMQVLSLKQILLPCESKSHFSHCRVDLRENVSPLFPNVPVTWSTSPPAPWGT